MFAVCCVLSNDCGLLFVVLVVVVMVVVVCSVLFDVRWLLSVGCCFGVCCLLSGVLIVIRCAVCVA